MASPKTSTLNGVIGFFEDPTALVQAMTKVRECNYELYDAFTPYPVHGLDRAQGLKRSPLPYVTFVAGLTGLSIGFFMQHWTHGYDWAMIVGGKPFNSWPASVPIMFELTVLLAALSTVGAMFAINGLPNSKKKSFDPSITCDRFAIWIGVPPATDPDDDDELAKRAKFKSFGEQEAKDLLKNLGATETRSVMNGGWF